MKFSSSITQVLKQFKSSQTISFTNHLIFGKNDEYRIEIANDFQTKIQAYRLLYKTYVEKEFAKPHSSKMWYSLFDAHPDTITIVVKEKESVRGAITIVMDTALGLPAEGVYQNEIKQLRQQNEIIAEIISLGIDSKTRGGVLILERLFNFSYLYAKGLMGATKFIITINPRHASFYVKKLLFSQKGQLKEYTKVSGNPAVFFQLDLNLIYRIVESNLKHSDKFNKTIYKSFISIKSSKGLLNYLYDSKRPMNRQELKYFFVVQKNIFRDSSAHVKLLQMYFPDLDLADLLVDQDSGFIALNQGGIL